MLSDEASVSKHLWVVYSYVGLPVCRLRKFSFSRFSGKLVWEMFLICLLMEAFVFRGATFRSRPF